MFKGGQKRLLPPIKNPLFNPNEDSNNEVRIATVVSSSKLLTYFRNNKLQIHGINLSL